jgi:hypothetical protein
MVPLLSLWLPIVLSAAAVFFVSSLIHMVLGYHKNDYDALPNQDAVMDALRPFNIPPGEYVMPRPMSMADMKSAEFQDKWRRGPVGFMTFMQHETMSMGPQLMAWFLYALVISVFAAYICSRALGADAQYMNVFRFASTVAFLGYAGGLWQQTIWYKHKVSTTVKSTFDALIFGLVTGGFFGWLWP